MVNPIGQNTQSVYGNPYAYGNTQPNSLQPGNEPIKSGATSDDYECKTCASRRYMDGSDDGGVSFQAPTNIKAGQSEKAVAGHEREHYNREGAKAQREGKKVVSNTIKIFYDVCPECGKKYASGGETTTVTKKEAEKPKPAAEDGSTIDLLL